jgi:hypothetical protein
MNLFKKPLVFLAVAILAIPVTGFSQYKFEVAPFWSYFKDLQRYELGVSYNLPTGMYEGVSQVRDNYNNFYGDTTIKRKLTGQQSVAGSIGIAVPFKGLGHISCLAMFFQLNVSQTAWNNLNETYTLSGSFNTPSTAVNASTRQVSLPIGVEYHVGCDVIKTKRLPFGGAFGLGILPQYNMTALEGSGVNNNTGSSFSITPYAKAEFSVLAGICFKVRVMYTLGNVPLMDVSNRLTSKLTDGPFNISSTSNLQLSLIFMPFSYTWRETQWYNTYDTYNRYDKLN